jgi:hypothetical protein
MLLPPRIQQLLCREYNESPHPVPAMRSHSPAIHALADLNVQQKPYSARPLGHFCRGFFSSVSADLVLTGAHRIGCDD